jgi:adenosylcobinamide-GDP ribazoletransferase
MSDLDDRPGASGSATDGLRLALGTLTVFRTRAPWVVDRASAGLAMVFAPVVGVLLAVPLMVLVWLLGYGPNGDRTYLWRLTPDLGLGRLHPPSPLIVAVLVVGLLALLTRGLHLDGLADTADGLGSSKSAGQALEVMRRSDIGPFGVVTLVLVLGLQVATLTQLLAIGHGVLAVLFAVAVSRLALPLACLRGTPAAREDGLGRAVAGTVSPARLVVSGALTMLSVAGLGLLVLLLATRGLVLPGAETMVAAVLVAACALGTGWLFVRRCVRRFGGITGDVLGAAVEITLAVVLLLLTFL